MIGPAARLPSKPITQNDSIVASVRPATSSAAANKATASAGRTAKQPARAAAAASTAKAPNKTGTARAARVPVAFEASVAGGIPIIKAIREGLAHLRGEDPHKII